MSFLISVFRGSSTTSLVSQFSQCFEVQVAGAEGRRTVPPLSVGAGGTIPLHFWCIGGSRTVVRVRLSPSGQCAVATHFLILAGRGSGYGWHRDRRDRRLRPTPLSSVVMGTHDKYSRWAVFFKCGVTAHRRGCPPSCQSVECSAGVECCAHCVSVSVKCDTVICVSLISRFESWLFSIRLGGPPIRWVGQSAHPDG